MRRWLGIPAVLVVMLLAPGRAGASAGQPDPSFSSDGVSEIQFGDSQDHLALGARIEPLGVRPDGSLLVGGSTAYQGPCYGHLGCEYFGVATLGLVHPDGSLDPSLAGDGTLETLLGGAEFTRLEGLSMQPDGSVLMGGNNAGGPFVARLEPGGDLDPGFGQGGRVHITIPNLYSASYFATASEPDGRVVVAVVSTREVGSINHDLTVLRLMPDGSLDPSFGTGGLVQVPMRGWYGVLGSVAIDSAGRIIVTAGTAATVPGDFNARLDFYRYEPDGTPDSAFGTAGHADYPVTYLPQGSISRDSFASGPSTVLSPPVVDGSGRIYALDADHPQGVVRLTSAGAPDGAYGPGGVADLGPLPGPQGTYVNTLGTDPTGRLLVGVAGAGDLVLGRRLSDGSPDVSFASGGWASLKTVIGQPKALTPLVLGDGRIVAAAGSASGACGVVVRLLGDGSPDTSAGPSDGRPCASVCMPKYGCPFIARRATISLRHRRRRVRIVSGRVESSAPGCHPVVQLFKPDRGADLQLRVDASPRAVGDTAVRYRFQLGRRVKARSVYALIRGEADPDSGTCGSARSPKLSLVRRH